MAVDAFEDARNAIAEVHRDFGAAGLDNPHLLDQVLPRLLPEAHAQARLIVAAASVRAASRLSDLVNRGVGVDEAIATVAAQLAGASRFGADMCRWVVSEYASVLGHLARAVPAVTGAEPVSGSRPGPGRDVPATGAGAVPQPTPVRPLQQAGPSDGAPPIAPVRSGRDEPGPGAAPWTAPEPSGNGYGVQPPRWEGPAVRYEPAEPRGFQQGYAAPQPGQGYAPPQPGQGYATPQPGQGYAPQPGWGYPPPTPVSGGAAPIQATPPSGAGAPGGAGPAIAGQPGAGWGAMPPTAGYPHPVEGAPNGRAGSQRRSAAQVVAETIQKGLLTFTAPSRMRQGTTKRMEVGIARTVDLAGELDDMFRNTGRRSTEVVNTADYMTVELVGDGFTIRPLSPPTQVLAPLARWEFDVTALRSGQQTLTLVGTCVVNVDGVDRQVAVPSFARVVEVDIDFVFGLRRFTATNWQWLLGTVIGLGGAIAAWIALFS